MDKMNNLTNDYKTKQTLITGTSKEKVIQKVLNTTSDQELLEFYSTTSCCVCGIATKL